MVRTKREDGDDGPSDGQSSPTPPPPQEQDSHLAIFLFGIIQGIIWIVIGVAVVIAHGVGWSRIVYGATRRRLREAELGRQITNAFAGKSPKIACQSDADSRFFLIQIIAIVRL